MSATAAETDGASSNVLTSVAYLVNSDGRLLYCQRWQPTTEARALVFLSHGYAEHIGYYKEIAEKLVHRSLYVFAHDHVGHGRSEGIRAYIEQVSDYVRDVFQHIDVIQKHHPTLPIFIVGHSMGGSIAIKAAMQRPNFFRGVVLVGPAVTPSPEMATPIKLFLARVLSRIIPQFPISHLAYESITRCTDAISYMKKDDLRFHGAAKAKWATAMLDCLQEIHNNLTTIEWPFLVQHGDHDKVVDKCGSQILFDLASSTDKTIKIYPDAYHNLIHELPEVSQEVVEDICEWVMARLQSQSEAATTTPSAAIPHEHMIKSLNL